MSCLSRHLFLLVLLSSSSHSPACVVAPVAFCHKLDRKIFTARIISACAALSIAGIDPAWGLWVPPGVCGYHAQLGRDPARGEGHGQLFFSAQTALWNTISNFEKLLLRFLKDLLAGFPGLSLRAGFLFGCNTSVTWLCMYVWLKNTLEFGVTRCGNPTLSPGSSNLALKNMRSVCVNRHLTSHFTWCSLSKEQALLQEGKEQEAALLPSPPQDFGVYKGNLEFWEYCDHRTCTPFLEKGLGSHSP